MNKLRNLSEICEKENFIFQIKLLGNTYCRLCLNERNIKCKYLSDKYDSNGIRPCLKELEEVRDGSIH